MVFTLICSHIAAILTLTRLLFLGGLTLAATLSVVPVNKYSQAKYPLSTF